MTARRHVLVLASLALCGATACNGDDAVEITVARGPGLDDAAAAAIHQLTFSFTGPETFAAVRAVPAGLLSEQRVRYAPQPGVVGAFTLSVLGRADDGVELASNSAQFDYEGSGIAVRVELGFSGTDLGVDDLPIPGDLADASAGVPAWTPYALSLTADSSADAGGLPNGVLEVGEHATVAPSWKNNTSMTASATSTVIFGGVSLAFSYSVLDSLGAYVNIGANASGPCNDCFQVQITGPSPRKPGHVDAVLTEQISGLSTPHVWPIHIGETFDDVPVTLPGYFGIETLAHHNAAPSCVADSFCPAAPMDIATFATILARIVSYPSVPPSSGTIDTTFLYNCAVGGTSYFTDVPPTDPLCPYANYLRARRIASGCSSTTFCPTQPLTRISFPTWIAHAIGPTSTVPIAYTDPLTLKSYDCNVSTAKIQFTDVPATDPACSAVHYLWARGTLVGCTSTAYCPTDATSRAAGAALIQAQLNLSLYAP